MTAHVACAYSEAAQVLQQGDWGRARPFKPPAPPTIGSRGCTAVTIQGQEREYAKRLSAAYVALDKMHGFIVTKLSLRTLTAMRLNDDFRGRRRTSTTSGS